MVWIIEGGRTLRGTELLADDLFVADGVIAANPARDARRFDASGLLVMPGLVDIHGDAHERQFQPRPGIGFPAALALRDSAAQLISCGITTAYLGVTLSWEPGLRSLDAWRDMKAALREMKGSAATDLRVHLRFEADNFDALNDAVKRLANLRFEDRERMLQACAATAMHDGGAEANEYLVVRAVADALDVPVPAIEPA